MRDNNEKVKLFISSSCQPCQEIKALIEQGRFNRENIDMIDLDTEEGFPYLEKMDLNRVPSAYKGKKACQLDIDRENNILFITCPGDEEQS